MSFQTIWGQVNSIEINKLSAIDCGAIGGKLENSEINKCFVRLDEFAS